MSDIYLFGFTDDCKQDDFYNLPSALLAKTFMFSDNHGWTKSKHDFGRLQQNMKWGKMQNRTLCDEASCYQEKGTDSAVQLNFKHFSSNRKIFRILAFWRKSRNILGWEILQKNASFAQDKRKSLVDSSFAIKFQPENRNYVRSPFTKETWCLSYFPLFWVFFMVSVLSLWRLA